VITKWDTIPGTYEDVVRFLYVEFEEFRQFWHVPRLRQIRIIPVSSFGPNGWFTSNEAAIGWWPVNAQTPLACTVPDLLIAEAHRAEQVIREKGARHVVRGKELVPFFRSVLKTLDLARTAADVLTNPTSANAWVGIDLWGIGRLLELIDPSQESYSHGEATQSPTESRDGAALLQVLQHFSNEVREFEKEYLSPGAIIDGLRRE
jgi:hypothetical protein